MPYGQVMHKFKQGQLHSGSKSGPKVTSRDQAIAIMLSEKRKAKTNPEYAQAGKTNVGLAMFKAMQRQSQKRKLSRG